MHQMLNVFIMCAIRAVQESGDRKPVCLDAVTIKLFCEEGNILDHILLFLSMSITEETRGVAGTPLSTGLYTLGFLYRSCRMTTERSETKLFQSAEESHELFLFGFPFHTLSPCLIVMLSKPVVEFCLTCVKITKFCLASIQDTKADQAQSKRDSVRLRSS